MPFTFFAHQAPVLPLKLVRPRWFDATAMCVAASAPDLAYPLGALGRHSHNLVGVMVWAIPSAVLAATVLRSGPAMGLFGMLGDLGPLRLRSFAVITRRRPAWFVTWCSAALGAGSHVVIDTFTHPNRWGARLLGWDAVVVTAPGLGPLSVAEVLQYLGHTLGSAACVALLWCIARQNLLARWYGADVVARARAEAAAIGASIRDRRRFWAATVAGIAAGPVWIAITGPVGYPFKLIDSALAGLALGSILVARPTPRSLGQFFRRATS